MTDRIICTHHAIKTNHVHDRPYLLTSFFRPHFDSYGHKEFYLGLSASLTKMLFWTRECYSIIIKLFFCYHGRFP